ncbi:chitin disaccharide deacetylase [Bacillus chungangensis]|uniref:Glycoside hydrolase/deacetylase ChbG (UPF0249 family) n=1 Tax=Bacillus chungangensis TaxID=587633 RepID=A0ABT9WPH3_9BACI|nr:chitin disaccharide deacetylase [Bacillus chungangensis]MDQ0175183.1 putative glycoside hydrolase/deacetylase ChbG (UPF0249 family) [Bacillus chungangensis]
MGKVIFNADDFGYSEGVNYGIVDAYSKGILTSTTLMANMPGFDHAVSLSKEFPGLGIGVHLTLTCGKPLLQNVDSLIENGNFKKLSFYQEEFQIDLDELYQEWDTQIQKVYRSGIIPSHLDSHHHTHTFSDNQKVVVELAKKYDLPVRGNFERKDKVKSTACFEPYFDIVGEPENSMEYVGTSLEEYLDKLIVKLKNTESIEIMCHPAYIDEALLTGSSFVIPRAYQTTFLIQSKFAEMMQSDKDIQLVNFHHI